MNHLLNRNASGEFVLYNRHTGIAVNQSTGKTGRMTETQFRELNKGESRSVTIKTYSHG